MGGRPDDDGVDEDEQVFGGGHPAGLGGLAQVQVTGDRGKSHQPSSPACWPAQSRLDKSNLNAALRMAALFVVADQTTHWQGWDLNLVPYPIKSLNLRQQ